MFNLSYSNKDIEITLTNKQGLIYIRDRINTLKEGNTKIIIKVILEDKNQALGDFGSVIFSAIQFALYTNPKRIYLVGCDCTDNGYFYRNRKTYNHDTSLVNGWQKLKEFASIHYPNIEIISINPVGLKGLFTDTYTD